MSRLHPSDSAGAGSRYHATKAARTALLVHVLVHRLKVGGRQLLVRAPLVPPLQRPAVRHPPLTALTALACLKPGPAQAKTLQTGLISGSLRTSHSLVRGTAPKRLPFARPRFYGTVLRLHDRATRARGCLQQLSS